MSSEVIGVESFLLALDEGGFFEGVFLMASFPFFLFLFLLLHEGVL
jgi:hypothetical protein